MDRRARTRQGWWKKEMAKLPAMQWYCGDWMKDPGVRSLSLAARGLWFDLLNLMHESMRRGYLQHVTGKPVTAEQIARMVGGSPDEVSRLLQELEDSAVFSRTEFGVIYCRRMIRDEQIRAVRADAGSKGGNARLLKQNASKREANGQAKPQAKPPPSSSVSISSSPSEESKDSCSEPPSAASEPVMIFPCVGKGSKDWSLTEAKLSEYRESFPGVDVLAQCRAARQWCIDNPPRQKTFSGMPAFLSRWLSKAQNEAGHGSGTGKTTVRGSGSTRGAGINRARADGRYDEFFQQFGGPAPEAAPHG